ncbi:DUF4476 domain-containing protein [Adhaeribacter pallidiroseus]|uniref:DUF4476 domain-containing protein n=1 Tax=Adhaeribacter pallidiroseus TaxID=2072847 RepID=A0A369QNC3_9BACT|nr:DUF4476 domain-containing protein [Adhaeribacter pallidiroseus]RDC65832.1 hypothetical protein AHMF7616_04462 [Adhaeribacter pallidiroseus]
MIRLAALFCGLFFWGQSVVAFPAATATFFSKRGESFQFIFDGRFVNRGATNVIRLHDIPAGFHIAEFRIPSRRGVLVHRTKVFLEAGRQSEFMLQVMGYGHQAFVQKVAEKPLYRAYPDRRPSLPRYPQPGTYDDTDYPRDNDSYQLPEETDNNYGTDQCRDVLDNQQIDRLLQSMATKRSESSKESIARQALSQNSILAEDLKAILEQFQYEDTRLNFAKFAYNATCDRRNFYVVNDAFSYETSIRELEQYINQR